MSDQLPNSIESFRWYYDKYYDSLCHFLSFYTHNSAVIEDVLQEVFMKLWENKERVEVRYIKTYLFQAAKNRMLNHLRDEKNRNYLLENWFIQQQNEQLHEECFDMDKFTELTGRAISQLPKRCREIFLLSRIEQLTYKQIAQKLNLSIKTVEAQISIALKRLREFISASSFLLSLLSFIGHPQY